MPPKAVCNRRSGVGVAIIGTSSGPGRAAICPNRRRISRSASNDFLRVDDNFFHSGCMWQRFARERFIWKRVATPKETISRTPVRHSLDGGNRPASAVKQRLQAHSWFDKRVSNSSRSCGKPSNSRQVSNCCTRLGQVRAFRFIFKYFRINVLRSTR